MTVWAAAAHLLDPSPPPPDLASPAAFAAAHSRGRWQPAPHLELIDRAVTDAIRDGRNIILSVSVRHGKSEYASKWLPAWYLGRWPDRRVILAAHEADFAARWGRAARDILAEHGHRFGVTIDARSQAANRWDIAHHTGGMLTVGVGGSPIGRGGDLIIVDDPIKSWEAAMSPGVRRKTIDWWTGTMESRREPGGAVVLICARWHEDDLTGFLLGEAPDDWTEIRLPAVCDDPATDLLGRAEGEALWPDRWPLTELERRRRSVSLALGDRVWQAQYQQTPRPAEGGMFPEDRWEITSATNLAGVTWCRGWDLAATAGGGDFTVGALIGRLPDGRLVVADVRRGQWSPDRVRTELVAAAVSDPPGTHIELPQDPGQAGADQAQQLVRLLAGYDARAIPQTGSKEVRATGLAAQQAARNVTVWSAPWTRGFVTELAGFPNAAHDDQVDAAATAANWLMSPRARPVTPHGYRPRAALHGTR